jgi:hypothetical protein
MYTCAVCLEVIREDDDVLVYCQSCGKNAWCAHEMCWNGWTAQTCLTCRYPLYEDRGELRDDGGRRPEQDVPRLEDLLPIVFLIHPQRRPRPRPTPLPVALKMVVYLLVFSVVSPYFARILFVMYNLL